MRGDTPMNRVTCPGFQVYESLTGSKRVRGARHGFDGEPNPVLLWVGVIRGKDDNPRAHIWIEIHADRASTWTFHADCAVCESGVRGVNGALRDRGAITEVELWVFAHASAGYGK